MCYYFLVYVKIIFDFSSYRSNGGEIMMDLQIVLTSTVVAAIITTLANIYSSKRTGNLKYITEERQKWRKEIRKIAENIADSPRDKIKKYLTKLKVRINANGIINRESYMEDGHIWELIEKLENSNLTVSEYEKQKDNLVNTISLLLKFDWERQKREVAGSYIKRMHRMVYVWVLLITVYIYGIPEDFSSASISPFYMVSLLFISIPCTIFSFSEMVVDSKVKLRVWIGIEAALSMIYIGANIVGFLKGDIDLIILLLGIFLIIYLVVDLVLSCRYWFSQIRKIENYVNTARKVSGLESNSSESVANKNGKQQSGLKKCIIRILKALIDILEN